MSDEQDGPTAEQPYHGLAHGLGARRVEVGGRLVQDDERGVAEERPREGDPPDLPRGERPAAVTDDGLVAAGQPTNEAVGACLRGGLADGRVRGRGAGGRRRLRS